MALKAPNDKDPLYQLLRDGKVKDFNERRAAGEQCDLTSADLRSVDLRGLEAAGIDFSNAYFRQSDLRGIDFTDSNLNGASINGAKISGTLFPWELSAQEILLSLTHGTRMRYQNI
jgi:uncharacterized protein YjbI with pentapeptide repeats